MTDASPFLQLQAIVKRFPGVLALNDVGLDVVPGKYTRCSVKTAPGSRRSSKSFLACTGRTPGRSTVDGRPVDIRTPHDAQARGISTIYQEFTLAPDMTVAENIFLGREPLRCARCRSSIARR
jgi:ABC-type sugar transport system ATPase subunit